MKKRTGGVIAVGVAMCVLVCAGSRVHAAADAEPPALCDYTILFNKMVETADLTDRLWNDTRVRNLTLAKKKQSIDRLSEDLKKTGKDSLEHQAIEQKLDSEKADLDQWTAEERKQVTRGQSVDLQRVAIKIEAAAREVAAKHSIAVIEPAEMPEFPKDAGSVPVDVMRKIVMARQLRRPTDAPDITQEVLALLNTKYAAVRPATQNVPVYIGKLGNVSEQDQVQPRVTLMPAGQGRADSPLKAALIDRVARLSRNLVIKFELEEKYDTDPAFPNGGQIKMANGMTGSLVPSQDKSSTRTISILNGRGRWDCLWAPAYSNIKQEIDVYAGDHVEEFEDHTTWLSGLIRAQLPVATSPVEIALGIRWPEGTKRIGKDVSPWLSAEEIRSMTEGVDDAGNAVLELADTRHRSTGRWTFRPDSGYALVHYVELTEQGHLFVDMQLGDLRKVGEFWLPFRVHKRLIRPRDNVVMEEETVKVQSLLLDDPENTIQRYAIHWPKGTSVSDLLPKAR